MPVAAFFFLCATLHFNKHRKSTKGNDAMTLSTQAYKSMLISAVAAGKLTHRRARRLFNSYLEERAA